MENDYFLFWRPPAERPDGDYTHGIRVEWERKRTPAWLRDRLCVRGGCTSIFEIGQLIYTPEYDAPEPVPGERPYAGWLFGRYALASTTSRSRRVISAQVGVTGPASLGEATQDAFHQLVAGFRKPLGWDHQLPFEVDAGLTAVQSWRLATSNRMAAIEPFTTIDVGTVRTAAAAGMVAKLGWHVAHQWLPEPGRRFDAHLFAGARASLVARDLFLDGTTFRESHHVTRRPLVPEWERGIRIRIDHLSIQYRVVTTGREYTTQPRSHPYAGITVAWASR